MGLVKLVIFLLAVGCDGVLGSSKVLDRCGVCGGAGNTCKVVEGRFTRATLPYGYNEVTILPRGACNINVTEMRYSRNYLALKLVGSGKYVFNENWKIDFNGEYRAAGSVFKYIRPSNRYKPYNEHILARGPLSEAVALLVLYQEKNPGIKYEYTIPSSSYSGVIASSHGHSTSEKVVSGHPTVDRSRTDKLVVDDNYEGVNYKSAHRSRHHGERQSKPVDQEAIRKEAIQRGVGGSLAQTSSKLVQLSAQIAARARQDARSGRRKTPSSRTTASYGRTYVNARVVPVDSDISSEDNTRITSISSETPHGNTRVDHGNSRSHNGNIRVNHGNSRIYNGNTRGDYGNPRVDYGRTRSGHGSTRTNYGHSRHVYGSARTGHGNTRRDYGNTRTYDPSRTRSDYGRTYKPRYGNREVDHYGSPYSPRYEWRVSGFTECSKTCGGGRQNSRVICVVRASLAVVTDENCNPVTKPRPQTINCNNNACPARWVAGSWGGCSATCGQGNRRRRVECRQSGANDADVSVSATRCSTVPKPATVESCELPACFKWKIGTWGQCSVRCGRGSQRRDVYCANHAERKVREHHCADLTQPEREQVCQMGPCNSGWMVTAWKDQCSADCGSGSYVRGVLCASRGGCDASKKPATSRECTDRGHCGGQWFTGPWSECSDSCESSVQTRSAVCLTHGKDKSQLLPDSSCDGSSKPEVSRACEKSQCKAKWYMTEWGECSATCGDAYRSRVVQCLTSDQRVATTCDRDHRPPSKRPCDHINCPTPPPLDPGCKDLMSRCMMVVRARLCSYQYYKQRCCRSCSRG